MGALLSTAQSFLNLLLPFTNPKTPLVQDLIHTIILCGTLYCAPQIAEYYNKQHIDRTVDDDSSQIEDVQGPPEEESLADLPLDENLVLQPDTDDEDAEPRPLAPTPPPDIPHGQQPPPPLQHEHEPFGGFAEAGPADPANERPRATPANRVIGTKKAKSLARKDQRRAYHEFHRQEAELRRLREAEGAEEREAALQAEKARRAEVEREIAERERAEREQRKEEERREQEEERLRRDRVVDFVRKTAEEKGAVNLVDLAWAEGKDQLWIERLVRASGILSQLATRGTHVMITSGGWVVNVDAELMQKAYADAVTFGNEHEGKISFDDFGSILEKVVKARAKT